MVLHASVFFLLDCIDEKAFPGRELSLAWVVPVDDDARQVKKFRRELLWVNFENGVAGLEGEPFLVRHFKCCFRCPVPERSFLKDGVLFFKNDFLYINF